jgi:hypothetical protein
LWLGPAILRDVTEEQALYIRDRDTYVGTRCTRGPWHDGQSGGAVLALLGHVLEDVPTLTPMSLTRLTVDIVRPVPVGVRLHLETEIIREGKKIQLVDLSVRAGDVVTTRARALRIRDLDVQPLLPGMPRSTSAVNPVATLPPPHELEGVDHYEGCADFLRFGAELRRSTEPIDGSYAVWCRLRVPVVAGEPVRATSRAALPLDLVNLLGVSLERYAASSINPDVTGHVNRAPVGEWVALTGHTYYAHGVGHGVSMATISDTDGVFGVTSTSQILDPT